MPNTALNRTTQALLTNKSGGALNYGDVVIQDTANASSFTTTTTAGLSTRQVGVILEPNGIANNASGMVAFGCWIPKVTLNAAATIGQFIKTHTVAGQATPHSSPQVEGDFGVALDASATPSAILFGSPNGPSAGGSGTVTNTGTLTSGKVIQGNGGVDVTVSSLTATVVKSASGTLSAATDGTDYLSPAFSEKLITETVTSGSQATVTFSSIPGTFRDLKVVVRGRGNAVATAVITRIQFNGDTGANYDYSKADFDGGASGGGSGGQGNAQTSADFGYISGSSAPANRSSSCTLFVYDYKGTTFTKTGRSIGNLITADSAGGYFTTNGTIGWRSTSAITQIDVILSSSTFVNGTVVSLYGNP